MTRYTARPATWTRRARRGVAGGVASATVAAIAAATLIAPAGAAVPDPWTTASISLVSTGSGHGTSSASFVNTANGFAVGDDGPYDGVVSSHDVVLYEVELAFRAGTARQVAVAIETPEYLEWRTAGDQLCRNGRFVEAFRHADTCVFLVPAGAVESFTVPLVLHGRDTGGRVIRNQTTSIDVGVAGRGPFSSSHADPVTVVSAPSADVVMLQPPNIRLNAAGTIQNFSASAWSAPAVGHFLAVPLPLSWAGFSPTSGVSVAGAWSGSLDVSGFPDTTTWRVNGAPATPSAEGLLSLGTNHGQVRIDFDLNQPWPEQPVGTTVDYAVRVIVDPSSFMGDGALLNNGTGWQPGDGQGADFSTQDPATGSQRGRPWPNNDFTAVRVSRPEVPPLGVFNKSIFGPWDSTVTIWEPANVSASAGASLQQRSVPASGTRPSASVAPGTELTSRLLVITPNTTAPDQLVVGDTWDSSQQQFDPARPLIITLAGVPVPAASWTAQWHLEARTPAQVANPAAPGWTTTPQADARAFRVVFAPGSIPFGTQEGAGNLIIDVPLTIRTDIDENLDGAMVTNVMVYGRVQGGNVTADTMSSSVILSLPRVPAVTITNTVTHIDGTAVSGPMPIAQVGDVLVHQVRAAVVGMPNTSTLVTPTITVELDRCVTSPVNTTQGWTMTVTPAIPGPSGRVCGDPESAPAVLIFTPSAETVAVAWTNRAQGNGNIGTITYTTRVAMTAPTGVQLDNQATIEIAEAPLPAHDEAPVLTALRDGAAGAIAADRPTAEIENSLSWTAEIFTNSDTDSGVSTDTAIEMPRRGDGT
ncbi:MAG: hypothetical protein FWG11_04575, partial [Promicromonosporaceae bacterium]|nr:hypothetical protein [Promicromonosporaceae bacterium]